MALDSGSQRTRGCFTLGVPYSFLNPSHAAGAGQAACSLGVLGTESTRFGQRRAEKVRVPPLLSSDLGQSLVV